jgi:hypothetical protein
MKHKKSKGDDIMKYKVSFFFIIFVCLSLFSINAQGNASNELTAFVNNAIKQLNAASVKIPQFDKATIDTIQNLGKINGNTLYLCWLKNEKERTGYIAVAGNGKSFQVVAFSATTAAPDYFLKKLQLDNLSSKTLDFSKAKQISFVDNVPLVATTKTLVGTDPIEISEIAASLSSVFNYLQNKQKIMFFGHSGSADPEYSRRLTEDPNKAKYPKDPNWKSFDQEARETAMRGNISRGQTPEERATSRGQQFSIIKPIIRKRLLNPVNMRERYDVLQAEQNAIENVTRIDISSGMKEAILLQQNYLEGNTSNLVKNIDVFFKTRGRTAKLDSIAFEKLQNESLPVILTGPENICGVILGYVDIDKQRFVSIFFSKTSSPITMNIAQKIREVRVASGLPAEPNREPSAEYKKALERAKEAEKQQQKISQEKGLPYTPPEKTIEERISEAIERGKAAEEKGIVVEDRKSKGTNSFENGVHLINSQQLSSWKVLNISKIEIGNNWGN